MRQILEQCLRELLDKANNQIVYFPLNDTLYLSPIISRRIKRDRFIQSIGLINADLIVTVVTKSYDKRSKCQVNDYTIGNFQDMTVANILKLAIRYQAI